MRGLNNSPKLQVITICYQHTIYFFILFNQLFFRMKHFPLFVVSIVHPMSTVFCESAVIDGDPPSHDVMGGYGLYVGCFCDCDTTDHIHVEGTVYMCMLSSSHFACTRRASSVLVFSSYLLLWICFLYNKEKINQSISITIWFEIIQNKKVSFALNPLLSW